MEGVDGTDRMDGMGTAKPRKVEEEGMFWKVSFLSECMHFVDSSDSDSFSFLLLALERATVLAMDAK